MPTILGHWCCAIVVSILLASSALAGPLATDAAAIPGWTGSTLFSGTNAGNTHIVEAIVDFAVYAPGDFSSSAALGNPADISGGTQYIYAYEVFREGLDANIASLTVALISGAVADNATWVGHDATTPEGGVPALSANFVPTSGPKGSVRWNFIPAFSGSNHSDILYFASPNEPHMLFGTVGGTFTTAATAALPSPIPEPGTCVLVLAGVCSMLAFRLLRSGA